MRGRRALEMLGFAGVQQRYDDISSIHDLEDISDPRTLDDETHTPIRERARQNKLQTAVLALLALVLGGLGVALAYEYIPLVVTNIYVQAGAAALIIYLAGRRGGMQSFRRSVEHQDEVTLRFDDHVFAAKGIVRDGGKDRPPLAVPLKGYRQPGMRPQPYTVADVDPQALERAPGSVDPDMPVAIELHPIYTEVTQTDTGKRAVQLSGGFEPAETRVEGDTVVLLRASAPDIAHEDDVREINEDYQRLLEEKKELNNRIDKKKQTINDLREQLHKPLDERVDKELDRVQETVRAMRGSPRQQERSVNRRRRQENGHDPALEQTNKEATTDA